MKTNPKSLDRKEDKIYNVNFTVHWGTGAVSIDKVRYGDSTNIASMLKEIARSQDIDKGVWK